MRRTGLPLTVQDLGRPGLGRLGVSPSGAMDPLALRAANLLLGNAPGAPALEATGAGLELEAIEGGRFALTGADLGATLGGRPLRAWGAHDARAGEVLSLTERRSGARAYVAFPGGVDAPLVLGSASGGLGSDGAPLRRGVTIDARSAASGPLREASGLLGWYTPRKLRVILSGDARLPPQAGRVLVTSAYRVSARSGRMGHCFEGPALCEAAPGDAISDAVAPGALQVAPDGRPILLMADRQTVGGYAVVAHLARADVPRAAQLWPGDAVSFEAVTREEAVALARAQEADLASVGAS